MAVVWGAGLPAEACPSERASAVFQLLVGTSGRPLEEGWAYP